MAGPSITIEAAKFSGRISLALANADYYTSPVTPNQVIFEFNQDERIIVIIINAIIIIMIVFITKIIVMYTSGNNIADCSIREGDCSIRVFKS